MNKIRESMIGKCLSFFAMLAFLVLQVPTAAYAASGTKVTHDAIKYFVPEKRIRLDATVVDPKGVTLVRAYFKGKTQADYVFVPMEAQKTDPNSYVATLPAMAKSNESLEYLFLVVNGANEVVKTEPFTVNAKASGDVPSWQMVNDNEPMKLFTEVPNAPGVAASYSDSVSLNVVESGARFGLVAQLYAGSSSAGAAGGAAAGGSGSAGATGAAASATSAGVTTAATAAVSMTTIVAAAAVAVGAAAAGGGGGGSSSSSNPTSPSSTTATSVSQVTGNWNMLITANGTLVLPGCPSVSFNETATDVISVSANGTFTGSGSGQATNYSSNGTTGCLTASGTTSLPASTFSGVATLTFSGNTATWATGNGTCPVTGTFTTSPRSFSGVVNASNCPSLASLINSYPGSSVTITVTGQ